MKYYKQKCKDGDKLSLPEHELEESPLTKLKGISNTNSFEVEVDKDVMKKYFCLVLEVPDSKEEVSRYPSIDYFYLQKDLKDFRQAKLDQLMVMILLEEIM